MKNRHRFGLLAACLVAMALAVAGSPGEAQSALETGWWWKGNPGAMVPVPPGGPVVNFPAVPPGLPAPPNANGGIMVAALPDGAVSIAAVRAPVDAQSLTLSVVENGNVGGAQAHLLACLPGSPWKAAAGGRWDDKPLVACDLSNGGGSVAGVPAADGASWTFPVQPLVVDGAIDVVIVPKSGGVVPGGVLEPFQLVFRPPTLESFVINPPPVAVEETPEPVEPPGEDVTEDTGDAFDAEEIVGDESYDPVASAALPLTEQSPRTFAPVRATGAGPDSGDQALAVLIVLLLAGATWVVSQQAVPMPASLTRVGARTRTAPVATPTVGGLGQFARTRSGKPPSLF